MTSTLSASGWCVVVNGALDVTYFGATKRAAQERWLQLWAKQVLKGEYGDAKIDTMFMKSIVGFPNTFLTQVTVSAEVPA